MNESPAVKKWVLFLVIFNLFLICGLILEYSKLYSTSQSLISTQQQLNNLKKQQDILYQSLKIVHQKLHQKQSQISLLNQVLWLIRQAKWQLKIMHQTSSAEHLLRYAQKIAQSNHWTSLNDALTQDLYVLKQKNIILDNELIEQIQNLYKKIEILQKQAGIHQTLTFAKKEPPISQYPQIEDLLTRIKPFISIERFHEPLPKILPPGQQYQVLSNILMLLTEMQMSGLNRDDASYRTLSKALSENWRLLSPQLHDPQINKAIDELQNVSLVLEKPMFFSSFAEVHHLLNSAGADL